MYSAMYGYVYSHTYMNILCILANKWHEWQKWHKDQEGVIRMILSLQGPHIMKWYGIIWKWTWISCKYKLQTLGQSLKKADYLLWRRVLTSSLMKYTWKLIRSPLYILLCITWCLFYIFKHTVNYTIHIPQHKLKSISINPIIFTKSYILKTILQILLEINIWTWWILPGSYSDKVRRVGTQMSTI